MHNPLEKMLDMMNHLQDREQLEDAVFELYGYNATFKDPLIQCRGRKEIIHMWKDLSRQMQNVECELERQAVTEQHLIGEWTLHFSVRWWPRRLSLNGVTWLELEANGQVRDHRDFWDIWSLARSVAPIPNALKPFLPGPLKRLV